MNQVSKDELGEDRVGRVICEGRGPKRHHICIFNRKNLFRSFSVFFFFSKTDSQSLFKFQLKLLL